MKKLFNIDLLLRNPNLRKIWLAMFVSRMGDGIYSVGLAWFTYNTYKTGWSVGLVLAANALATFVVGIIAGVYADKKDKKNIMIFSNLISGILVALIPLLIWMNGLNYVMLVVISFLLGATSQFFEPVLYASIPKISKENELVESNSAIGLTDSLGYLVGPFIGGLLITYSNANVIFIINSVSFLLAAVFISRLHVNLNTINITKKTPQGFLKDCSEGLIYVVRNKTLFSYFGFSTLALLAYSPLFVVLPVYLDDILHLTSAEQSSTLGVLYSLLAFGQLIGFSLISYVNNQLKVLVVIGYLLHAVGFSSFYFFHNAYINYISIIIAGVSFGLAGAAFQTALQKQASPNFIGRVFGFKSALNGIMLPLGRSLTGLYLVTATSTSVFLIMASMYVVASLWGYVSIPKNNNNFEEVLHL
ncbi:MFS transporter [Paenibacillus gansuensis]|uniref:MFS transporter n=1 Tax=Paenibacillus gansuensis TaxID=306542 RepID=A0ABW5PIQ1_9BACL